MESSNQPTTTTPVDVPTHQLVIHRPMSELTELVEYLNASCVKYLGREHDPDEGCERTHCHFAIQYKYSKQSMAKYLNKLGIKGSDNFGHLTVCEKTKEPYDFKKLSIYILKGKVDDTVRHSAGITLTDVKYFGLMWKDNTEDSVNGKKIKRNDEWEQIKASGMKHFKDNDSYTFINVRKFVMRWYWDRDGILPNPSSYKRYASSLFYALSLRNNNRSACNVLDEITELWY